MSYGNSFAYYNISKYLNWSSGPTVLGHEVLWTFRRYQRGISYINYGITKTTWYIRIINEKRKKSICLLPKSSMFHLGLTFLGHDWLNSYHIMSRGSLVCTRNVHLGFRFCMLYITGAVSVTMRRWSSNYGKQSLGQTLTVIIIINHAGLRVVLSTRLWHNS